MHTKIYIVSVHKWRITYFKLQNYIESIKFDRTYVVNIKIELT